MLLNSEHKEASSKFSKNSKSISNPQRGIIPIDYVHPYLKQAQSPGKETPSF